ncbi:MAG TPA: type VI secretion system lipoprotein TssJ [Gammaproteobacteria bacterium]|nr:type VI secretion system lipoprotein TssJ [Gammaproteobacteria bacterium]|tara:strand:- start:1198 stop:1710 length:513 start_codon:yes stop_codon:yes gene_type:complete
MRKYFNYPAICMLSLILAGCAAPKNVEPLTKFTVMIHADDSINPSKGALAKPVVVRFYQLKDPGKFSGEKGIQLFTDDDAVLADTLVAKQELTPLLPGESREVEVLMHQGAKFFAVLAEFSEYRSANYRSILPLGPPSKSSAPFDVILVTLSGNNVAVFKPAVKKPWWKI